jgi:hypothetical protein
MARKLLIHIGPPKTGTSAVQHILSTYRSTSLIYPKTGLWPDGSHHNLIMNFFQDFTRPDMTRASVNEMLASIASEAKTHDGDLLISSEAMTGREIGPLVARLLDHLTGGPWEPKIIFVAREHFEIIASLYNQSVKDAVHMERRSPDDYLTNSRFSYRWVVSKFIGLQIPIIALNYHPATSFVNRFLNAVGFSSPEPLKPERRNISLSTKGLIATLAANNVAKSIDDRDRIFAALHAIRPLFAPSRFIFSRTAAKAADVRFSEDRRFLSDAYGIELSQPDWERQEESFYIDRQDLAEIADATRALGRDGDAIVAFASRYVRQTTAPF